MDKIKTKIILAMAILGTTGFFLRYAAAVPVATVALICCLLGIPTVLVMMKLTKRKLRWRYIKRSLPMTILSGAALGGSLILLSVAQKSSDSAIATVYYFFATAALSLLAPVLGEKFRKQKLFLCALTLGGLVLTTGFWKKGIVWDVAFLFALGAGILQGAVVVCNKKLLSISSYDKTLLQLAAAAAVLLPYCLLTGGFAITGLGATGIAALVILGVLHTGFTCRVCFDGVVCLPVQTIVIYSYIVPAMTMFISAFMMRQKLQVEEVLGVVLILVGIMVGELSKENFGGLFEKKG